MPQELTLDLFPAWEGAVLEDWDLQERACDRLVEYINKGFAHNAGRTRAGSAPLRVQAERIEIGGASAGAVKYGVRLAVPVEMEIRWR